MQKNYRKQESKIIINLFNYTLLSVPGIACATALILAGCAQQSPGQLTPQQKITTKQIFMPDNSTTGINKTKAMEIAEGVLVCMHFTIDKLDPNSGFIKTRPLPGAQFFEFWRSDNIGTKNWINSNLHSIRRTVEVNISQHAKELDIKCVVKIQRLSLPERQITSTRAYEMFSMSSPGLQTLQLNPEQASKMSWIDLGRDTELENEILKHIEIQTLNENQTSRSKMQN